MTLPPHTWGGMNQQGTTLTLKDALDALADHPSVASVETSARAIGVSPITLRRRIQDGALRAVRTSARRGGRYRVFKVDLARLLVEMAR